MSAKGKACIFCEALRAEPKEALVVERDERAFVMLNKYPYNNGHLLVAPIRHVADLEALEPEEATALMESVRRVVGILKQAYRPDGLNLGMNMGRVAGAGVDEHLHFHVLPRWNGDTNFMSVCAETRVISEALAVTWETLSPFFRSGAVQE